ATAVSEIARNAFQYASGGRAEFLLDGPPFIFTIRISDRGPGIRDLQAVLDGRFSSATGLGMGLAGARRLMDHFTAESTVGVGTTIALGKELPRGAVPSPANLARLSEELARRVPHDPAAELRHQNQELLGALEELTRRQEELTQLNRELA